MARKKIAKGAFDAGQDPGEGQPGGAGLRDVAAEDAINFTNLDKIISGGDQHGVIAETKPR